MVFPVHFYRRAVPDIAVLAGDGAAVDPPGAPVLSIDGYPDTTSVDISWTTPTGSPTSYEIWIDDVTLFDTVSGNTANVYGLSLGTDYSIYVKAVNAGGAGDPSNTVTANTYGAFLLYDTFTDTDGTDLSAHTPESGGPHTMAGVLEVQSNEAVFVSLVSGGNFAYSFWPASADGYTQASLNISGNGDLGIVVNAQDENHYWMIWYSLNQVILYEVTSHENFVSRGSSFVLSCNTLKAVTNGDTIQVYVEDVLKITYAPSGRSMQTNALSGLMIYGSAPSGSGFIDAQSGV